MKRTMTILGIVIGSVVLFGAGYAIGMRTAQNHAGQAEAKVTSTKSNAPVETGSKDVSQPEYAAETKRIDREIIPYLGNRKDETRELLEHSRGIIDAYLIGTGEGPGIGDFQLRQDQAEDLLQNDYVRFKTLYADELTRGKGARKELETYKDGPLPWNKYQDKSLLRIVLLIDEAYEGAIDNLSWSNTEPKSKGIDEKKEYENIREIDGKTRFMAARDLFQRYSTWLYGGKLEVSGINKDKS